MKHRLRGFTIVELMIIIATISILATIGIMSWNGVTVSSRDRMREQDVRQWASTFNLYKSRYIVWPVIPTNDATSKQVCLGVQLSSTGDCGQYTSSNKISGTSADAALINTEVSKISKIPVNSGKPIDSSCCKVAGPFVSLSQVTTGTDIKVTGKFIDFFENGCPQGFTNYRLYSTPSENLSSGVLNGLPNSPSANPGPPFVCGIEQSFTYNPN